MSYYVIRWVNENSASVVPSRMISEENIALDEEVSVVEKVNGKMKVYKGTVLFVSAKKNDADEFCGKWLDADQSSDLLDESTDLEVLSSSKTTSVTLVENKTKSKSENVNPKGKVKRKVSDGSKKRPHQSTEDVMKSLDNLIQETEEHSKKIKLTKKTEKNTGKKGKQQSAEAAKKPLIEAAQKQRIEAAMAARKRPVNQLLESTCTTTLSDTSAEDNNSTQQMHTLTPIFDQHPQYINSNNNYHSTPYDHSQSFSSFLQDVHTTQFGAINYPTIIDSPVIQDCSTPKSTCKYLTLAEGQELQKEVSMLKSAVDLLHDEIRTLKRKLKGQSACTSLGQIPHQVISNVVLPPQEGTNNVLKTFNGVSKESLENLAKVYSNPLDGLKALLDKLFSKDTLANSSIKGTQCNLQKGQERGALNKESLEIMYFIMRDVFKSSQEDVNKMIRGQQKQLRKQLKE